MRPFDHRVALAARGAWCLLRRCCLEGQAEKPDLAPTGAWRHGSTTGIGRPGTTPTVPARARQDDRGDEAKGVRTLFLATSHHSQAADVVDRRAVSQTIEAAHRRGMKVVAWYQPSLVDPERDYRRAMAAISFRDLRRRHGSTRSRSTSRRALVAARLDAQRAPSAPGRPHSGRGGLGVRAGRDRALAAVARPLSRIVARLSVRAARPSPSTCSCRWPTGPSTRPRSRARYDYARDSMSGIRHATRSTDVAVHAIGGTARHATSAEHARLPRRDPRLRRGSASASTTT